MYTNLLEHYATNSVRTNHYILSFMMRLSTSRVSHARPCHVAEMMLLTQEDVGGIVDGC